MSLYDDIDTDKKTESATGWASGIKFLQSHINLKKAVSNQPKREPPKKSSASLAPVINFKRSKDDDGDSGPSFIQPYKLPSVVKDRKSTKFKTLSAYLSKDPAWQFDNEYDPVFPNDYDKALKELRARRDKEAEEEEKHRKEEDLKDEDDDYYPSSSSSKSTSGGVAIAPPSFYNQDEPSGPKPSFTPLKPAIGSGLGSIGAGATAAATIMAKYGYKEGQGLGKKEQGMATALQVEKTSMRTGRIIHEKDVPAAVVHSSAFGSLMAQYNDDEDIIEPESIKELQAKPSRVILLVNMVSPAEVDDDLEPEVKEECLKYGEVSTVTVFQMPDVDGENAIRIFVEFADVSGAGIAQQDLNGRFFGGKQVKATYYDYDKFSNLDLTA